MLGDANVAFDNRNYITAKQFFDQLLELEPNNVDFLERRGFCNNYIGEHIQAIEDYTHAISIEPRYAFYFFRSNAYVDLKQYDLAINDLLKVIEMRPSHASAHNNLGMNYIKLGKTDVACSEFSLAIQYSNESNERYLNNKKRYCK